MVLLEQEYSHCVIDVLFDSLFGSGDILLFQIIHLLGFGFALFVCQGCVGHGLVDGVHLLVQFVLLVPDALVNIIVGCTGGRVAFAGSQFDVDCSVFEEEAISTPSFPEGWHVI